MQANTLIETLMRHGIGFDTLTRWPDMFGNVANFPPHNIEKLDEDKYRLTLAVAGYVKDEISISLKEGMLTITGTKRTEVADDDTAEEAQDTSAYSNGNGNGKHLPVAKASERTPQILYRGIAFRNFSRQFKLGDYVNVANATLENGLLVIDLERKLPEELQPKQIPIQ